MPKHPASKRPRAIAKKLHIGSQVMTKRRSSDAWGKVGTVKYIEIEGGANMYLVSFGDRPLGLFGLRRSQLTILPE